VSAGSIAERAACGLQPTSASSRSMTALASRA
jgi:hypothetical protein